MVLSQDIETIDVNCTKEQYEVILLKYDNLIQDCMFEEIPNRYKVQVANCFTKAERYIPIQLNGIIGNTIIKRNSKILKNVDLVNTVPSLKVNELSSEIV
jgi:hypothetical protein